MKQQSNIAAKTDFGAYAPELSAYQPTGYEAIIDFLNKHLFDDTREGTAKAERVASVADALSGIPSLLSAGYDTARSYDKGDKAGMAGNMLLAGIAAAPFIPEGSIAKDFKVFHGTPNRFAPEPGAPLGRFRDDKINTGEGTQHEGLGHYLTDVKDIASATYSAMRGPNEQVKLNGQDFYDLLDKLEVPIVDQSQLNSLMQIVSSQKPKKEFTEDSFSTFLKAIENVQLPISQGTRETLSRFDNMPLTFQKPGGWVYEAKVKTNPDNFINMHMPIAYQNDKVIEAVDSLFKYLPKMDKESVDPLTGEWLKRGDIMRKAIIEDPTSIPYQELRPYLAYSDKHEARDILKDMGIAGQKYFAGTPEGRANRRTIASYLEEFHGQRSTPHRDNIVSLIKEQENIMNNTPLTGPNMDKITNANLKLMQLQEMLHSIDATRKDPVAELARVYATTPYNYVVNDPSLIDILDREFHPR